MSILIFFFTITILVLAHELGHFCVARYFNVSIDAFSIGFGRPLIKFNSIKYQTEFRISPFLLGGYVRFSEKLSKENDLVLFEELAIWKKILILLAGPAVNLMFAFLALIIFFKMSSYVIIPYIGHVNLNSLANKIGFEKGQRIIAVNYQAVNSWEEIFELIRQKQNPLSIEVKSSNISSKQFLINEPEKYLDIKHFFSKLGMKPMLPLIPAIIGKIDPGSVAEKMQLNKGDEILFIDKRRVLSMFELSEYVRNHPDKKVTLEVKRGNQLFNLEVSLEHTEQNGKKFGKLGIYSPDLKYFPRWFHYYHESWFGALTKSLRAIQHFLKIQLGIWWNLKNELSQLSGPIGIAKAADQAWSIGVKTYLFFVIWLNIGLAVVNLLPIPILDGGQCIMLLLNKFFPKLLNQSRQKIIAVWSIIFLIGLFLVGVFNDCSF